MPKVATLETLDSWEFLVYFVFSSALSWYPRLFPFLPLSDSSKMWCSCEGTCSSPDSLVPGAYDLQVRPCLRARPLDVLHWTSRVLSQVDLRHGHGVVSLFLFVFYDLSRLGVFFLPGLGLGVVPQGW